MFQTQRKAPGLAYKSQCTEICALVKTTADTWNANVRYVYATNQQKIEEIEETLLLTRSTSNLSDFE